MNGKLKKIIQILTEKKQTISTMESCTGGALVNAITNIEGSSNVLKFSAVTYSNEYKIKMGVSKEVIKKNTVYSIQTAKEMTKAISNFTNSDYAVGITGKLNRVDENNLSGKNNEVFVSIYNKEKEEYKTLSITVTKDSRDKNKEEVLNIIIDNLYKMIK